MSCLASQTREDPLENPLRSPEHVGAARGLSTSTWTARTASLILLEAPRDRLGNYFLLRYHLLSADRPPLACQVGFSAFLRPQTVIAVTPSSVARRSAEPSPKVCPFTRPRHADQPCLYYYRTDGESQCLTWPRLVFAHFVVDEALRRDSRGAISMPPREARHRQVPFRQLSIAGHPYPGFGLPRHRIGTLRAGCTPVRGT